MASGSCSRISGPESAGSWQGRLEAPRLSGMLRTFTTDRGQHFDPEREQIDFLDKLQKKRAATLPVSGGDQASRGPISGEEAGTPQEHLSWSQYCRGIPQKRRQEMQSKWEQFLGIMKSPLGEHCSPDELRSLTFLVYSALTAPTGDVAEEDIEDPSTRVSDVRNRSDYTSKRHLVCDLLGPLSHKQYEDLRHLVSELFHFRRQYGPGGHVQPEIVAPGGNTELSATPAIRNGQEKHVRVELLPRAFGESLTVDFDKLRALNEEDMDDIDLETVDSLRARFHVPAIMESDHQYGDEEAEFELQGQDADGFDLGWLRGECSRVAERIRSQTGSSMTGPQLASIITSLLRQPTSADQLQGELFELVGETGLELMEGVLAHRDEIVCAVEWATSRETRRREVENQHHRSGPVLGYSVGVGRDRRKQEKREMDDLRRMDSHEEWLIAVGFADQTDTTTQEMSLPAGRGDVRSDLTQALGVELGVELERVQGRTFVKQVVNLPPSAFRNKCSKYEEVVIPLPLQRVPEGSPEDLVPIDSLDPLVQMAFKGTKTLNRLQSKVFESALYSNENLLICAPTGAGKTNVAMLTIMHEISKHAGPDGKINRDSFKIVYVAPMKALAAEMVANFSKRLSSLGIVVKEYTGDMQLSRKEVSETQILVVTPEKWDVVTRKSGDALVEMVKLLIVDEVHLLAEDRGSVIESIIARTLRQVEISQSMVRIVGLSATLPNYQDVAVFLRCNPHTGLFYFDATYRPVPLAQTFIGASERNAFRRVQQMNDICYEKVRKSLNEGHQVLVFVHSRKDTINTAKQLLEYASASGETALFRPDVVPSWALREMEKARSHELRSLFSRGIGCHNAGLLRSDRNLSEKLFLEGHIRVLVSTATLAWGVNLPAHTVVIKGTQLYNPEKGQFVDLGMLDVMQIFGRAGRPQFDTEGEAILITSHDKLDHYLAMVNRQTPIESQFIGALPDQLNAEIVLGTVTNVREAIQWLSYTYLYIRMMKSPMAYGIPLQEKARDRMLLERRQKLIEGAAQELDEARMLRFNKRTGTFSSTDLGRVAAHFYIQHGTILDFTETLNNSMTDADIFHILCKSREFEKMQIRDEELTELETLMKSSCPITVRGGVETSYGKCNILLQAYISQARIDSFSLSSDCAFVIQSAPRILRALFEIALRRKWTLMSERLLTLCTVIERRQWEFMHPLRQFQVLTEDVCRNLEMKDASLDDLWDMDVREIGSIIRNHKAAPTVARLMEQFPYLNVDVQVQPITRSILRFQLSLRGAFQWIDRYHGNSESWFIWVEDPSSKTLLHHEYFVLSKKEATMVHSLNFTVPLSEGEIPPQFILHAMSERWLGGHTVMPVSFKHLILPQRHIGHTPLLKLESLPKEALGKQEYMDLFPRFEFFNPIQTQIFFNLFHTDENVLLGAPTGSGKTIAAEFAMFRVFNEYPKGKIIYIGPLKALVRERMEDWKERFGRQLGKKVVELTGDFTPDLKLLQEADIVLTTPEKWDGISRSWKQRSYVRSVKLMVFDEIHLLGGDRGPILEVIVSRMRYIAWHLSNPIRFVGLSTALANPVDLAEWLGIPPTSLYNFNPSVRPVPVDVHIQGYPGQQYCPRMKTMNKPTYLAIQEHSYDSSALVFVSSRRQTRLTAMDLISLAASDERSKSYLQCPEEEMALYLETVRDENLKHTLMFGIGLHHAGLGESDKKLVENLFAENKIQILVSTSTLAWGVNLPAHLVVVKGTEYFDPATHRYADYPITDVLQMIGRAGRPQFDDRAVAVVLVHEPKKDFYAKFLYQPFPVESSLADVLVNHVLAECVSGTVASRQDGVDYLTWTYLFRRLLQNPTYYGLADAEFPTVEKYLADLVDDVFQELEQSECLILEEDGTVEPTNLGRLASYYYLEHESARLFAHRILPNTPLEDLLFLMCDAIEFRDFPVRHNEELLTADLNSMVDYPLVRRPFDSPHTKAILLLQAHFSRLPLPIPDFITDTKSVIDQSIRLIQAMVDIAADRGYLKSAIRSTSLLQMIMQARWVTDSPLLMLPYMSQHILEQLSMQGVEIIPDLQVLSQSQRARVLRRAGLTNESRLQEVLNAITRFPEINLEACVESTEDSLSPGSTAQVVVNIQRVSRYHGVAYAPRYPKRKDESWWVIVGREPQEGSGGEGELLALKRMSFKGRTTVKLTIELPSQPGLHEFQVYLIPDSYLGLDMVTQCVVDIPLQGRAAPVSPWKPVDKPAPTAVDALEKQVEEMLTVEDAADALDGDHTQAPPPPAPLSSDPRPVSPKPQRENRRRGRKSK